MRFANVDDIDTMLECVDSHEPPLATLEGAERKDAEKGRKGLRTQLKDELKVKKEQGKGTHFAIVACRKHGRKANDIVGYTSWFYARIKKDDVWGAFSLELVCFGAQADLG